MFYGIYVFISYRISCEISFAFLHETQGFCQKFDINYIRNLGGKSLKNSTLLLKNLYQNFCKIFGEIYRLIACHS